MADLQERFGGYDCEFVNAVPEELQTECSICLHILRDPRLVDCCGYRFCKDCIETHISENDNCPLCKQECPSTMADKQLDRILKQKVVRCSHKEEGCMWTGELYLLNDHLDPAERLKGCEFQKLKCSFCDTYFQRNQIESHELECPRRIVKCEYCYFFKCPQEELVKHWEECNQYPVECPNGCGAKKARQYLKEHVENECSLTTVDCEFAYAGCKVRKLHKDMSDHLKESMQRHLSMLKKKYSELDQEYQKEKGKSEMVLDIIRWVNQKDQVFVENLPWGTTEQMLRSLFGQYGRLHSVWFYSDTLNALLKYDDDDSIHKLFRTYNSRGIKLRGAQLKCAHLRL